MQYNTIANTMLANIRSCREHRSLLTRTENINFPNNIECEGPVKWSKMWK